MADESTAVKSRNNHYESPNNVAFNVSNGRSRGDEALGELLVNDAVSSRLGSLQYLEQRRPGGDRRVSLTGKPPLVEDVVT